MAVSLSQTEILVLTELFVSDQQLSYGVTIEDLRETLVSQAQNFSPREIAIALGKLRNKGLASREEFESGEWGWKITIGGSEVFTEVASDDDDRSLNAPEENRADHDPWEPLPLDRQSEPLEAAIAKIDDVVDAVIQDNGYAVSEPDERNYVLSALQAGVEAMKVQTVIYQMQFTAFIWKPLDRIATRFKENAIGALAIAAIEAVKAAFSEVFKRWLSGL